VGFGVVTGSRPCCAEALASTVVVVSEDGLAVDFVGAAFEASGFAPDTWTDRMTGGSLLASKACLTVAEALLAVWCPAAASRDWVVAVVGAISPALRCGAGCCGCWGCGTAWVALPVSAGMFESTSAPKLSLPCDGSFCTGFAGGG
jgi:hypothetical protein